MSSIHNELRDSATQILNAFPKASRSTTHPSTKSQKSRSAAAMDSGEEECVELLAHLVDRFGTQAQPSCQGMEDACIFLLQHLAERLPRHVGSARESLIH